MIDFAFVLRVYPNGQTYQQVSLRGIPIGHLVESESGFTVPGWRKPITDKNEAMDKMRRAAIAERKRKMSALQSEINKLALAQD